MLVLGRLGVVRLDREELVLDHVLPLLAKQAPPSQLPALLGLARRQQVHCAALRGGQLAARLVSMGARLLCAGGGEHTLGSAAETPYLGPALRASYRSGAVDFVPEPPPPTWREIDEAAYLEVGSAAEWKSLFAALRLDWFPAIVPCGEGDWDSPTLEGLLRLLCSSRDVPRLTALLAAVGERWTALPSSGRVALRDRCLKGGKYIVSTPCQCTL